MTEYIVEWTWNVDVFKTEEEALDYAFSQWYSIDKEDQDGIPKFRVYEVKTDTGALNVKSDLTDYMTRMIKDFKEIKNGSI